MQLRSPLSSEGETVSLCPCVPKPEEAVTCPVEEIVCDKAASLRLGLWRPGCESCVRLLNTVCPNMGKGTCLCVARPVQKAIR